ncbi:MAG TPA: FeoA family protein [Pyrinomonadaceae bacterium]|jgi:ferrous iron transport protein A|nr:FeoA family protein [Pyrinomonadaceae bacterium]
MTVHKDNDKTLAGVAKGQTAKVSSVTGTDAVTRRLMEMGIVPGEMVRVVKSAPFGDPMEIKVRGYHLAVRRNEARMIEVGDAI